MGLQIINDLLLETVNLMEYKRRLEPDEVDIKKGFTDRGKDPTWSLSYKGKWLGSIIQSDTKKFTLVFERGILKKRYKSLKTAIKGVILVSPHGVIEE